MGKQAQNFLKISKIEKVAKIYFFEKVKK